MIDEFTGKYFFLSNFYPCRIEWEGLTYKSSEAAYQASKSLNPKVRKEFVNLEPGESKRKGREIKLRSDWESVKVNVMSDIVRIKFTSHPKLKEQLIATGDEKLIEGNWWGDKFWGLCEDEGKNMLGRILMGIREELK